MPNVVTPFSRKRHTATHKATSPPRHRRDGYFDEHDQWHDSTESDESATHRAKH